MFKTLWFFLSSSEEGFRKMFRTRHNHPVFIGDYKVLSEWAAKFIAFQYFMKITEHKKFILGTATGSSPQRVYTSLFELAGQGRFNPTDETITLLQLDNYRVTDFHPSGYDTEILNKVSTQFGLTEKSLRVPSGAGNNDQIAHKCRELDFFLKKNPVDVQLLGLGVEGHIAFLESLRKGKGKTLEKFLEQGTEIVDLSESTRVSNAIHFGNNIKEVPKEAVTRGPKSILASEWIIVLVNNASKALAAYAALTANVCTFVPASILQLHPQTIWLIAEEAGDLFESWNDEQNTFRNLPTVESFETWHSGLSRNPSFRGPRFK